MVSERICWTVQPPRLSPGPDPSELSPLGRPRLGDQAALKEHPFVNLHGK